MKATSVASASVTSLTSSLLLALVSCGELISDTAATDQNLKPEYYSNSSELAPLTPLGRDEMMKYDEI